MSTSINVGSRKSPLALVQVKEIFDVLKPVPKYELITFDTAGDKDKITALSTRPADDFFTDALDQALLNSQIDIAIHSAKDLPAHIHEGLEIFALTAVLDDTDSWIGRCPWANLPANAKVGTSSVLRQKQTKELHPTAQIIDIRGTIEERIQLVKEGKIDGIIVATCALKRLKLSDLITDVLPWEGMPLQGQLAVMGRRDDIILKRLFAPLDVRLTYGKVILVGAGPGDPSLITQKGIEALRKADCVFYDYLVNKDLLQYAPHALHIYAGKRKKDHSFPQEQLSKMLKNKAMQGSNVVRLKGGDPLIFGRGAEEINYLRSYFIDVDVIPGVSSATGIPSLLGVPLTARGIATSVAFISAHSEDENIHGAKSIHIPKCDTLVILMGLSKSYEIIETLKKDNWPLSTPMMIVANGTRDNEQIVTGTLQTIENIIKESKIAPPALIIVGKTVDFYKQRRKRTYLHCGTHPMLYQSLGDIITWPMIEMHPVVLTDQERERFGNEFDKADLFILTSPSAVNHFMPLISAIRSQSQIKEKIYALIGQHSASVFASFGGHAHIIADDETAVGLFKTLNAIMDFKSKNIFFPRSSIPNPFLINALKEKGAVVHEWAVYTNIKPVRGPLPAQHIDGIIFTSPSTVINFLEDYETIPSHWDILAKGPVTHKTLREGGYRSKIII